MYKNLISILHTDSGLTMCVLWTDSLDSHSDVTWGPPDVNPTHHMRLNELFTWEPIFPLKVIRYFSTDGI